MTRYLRILPYVLLLGAAGLPVWAQATAESVTVAGRVLDSEGRPLPDARISIFPMDTATSGPVPWAITDSAGRYRLIMPPYRGRIRFCAVKESAGYADTHGLLFSSESDSMPIVSVDPGVSCSSGHQPGRSAWDSGGNRG